MLVNVYVACFIAKAALSNESMWYVPRRDMEEIEMSLYLLFAIGTETI